MEFEVQKEIYIEAFALLGCYAAQTGRQLQTFREGQVDQEFPECYVIPTFLCRVNWLYKTGLDNILK